jgi:hypothetical protein
MGRSRRLLAPTRPRHSRLKINQIKINGFRCFRDDGELKLKMGKSLCLQAENGRGKSTVADALDFWCTGNVAWTRREGVGLGALIHLDG